MSAEMNIFLANIGAWAHQATPAGNASADSQAPHLAIPLGPPSPLLGTGLDKPVDEPLTFLNPSSDPKPQPASLTPPIRDPQGYKTLGAGPFGGNTEHNRMGGHSVDPYGLKDPLDGFGVDLERPAFARMMYEQGLVGLTPVQRFLRE